MKIDKNLLICEPFKVPKVRKKAVLGLGAELKSSICLINDQTVYLSKAGPALMDADNYRQFVDNARKFIDSLDGGLNLAVCDLHPGYSSSIFAKSLGFEIFQVQHHYAHIAACMVENGIYEPVIGIAADGTGYGTDGQMWGCEILKCDMRGFERAGHLKYFKLFGGDMASVETWRPAAGVMSEVFGDDFQLERVDNLSLDIAKKRFTIGSGIVKTSSLGRLFDAVSFLLGLCDKNEHEAQAAIALEDAATEHEQAKPLDYELIKADNGSLEIDFRPIIRHILKLKTDGVSAGLIAARFHETVAIMLMEAADFAAKKAGINKIILSGGCFLNKILLKRICSIGKEKKLEVMSHRVSSPGDGCIALGQAILGSFRTGKDK